MRSGKNALSAIEAVKAKLEELKPSLPAGVEIVTTYDRSQLIERAVDNLARKTGRGVHRCRLVCARIPAARALGAGRHRRAAGRRADRVHRHALPGRERQHHVAGRHRHRHRRDGGCGDSDDRERAQALEAAHTARGRPTHADEALDAGD